MIAAGVAVVAIAAAFIAQYSQRASPEPETARPATETLTLIAPVDRVSTPFDFQWASAVPSPAYRIEVDAAGRPVPARVLRTDRIAAPAVLGEEQLRTPQSYTWKITVFDDRGIFVAGSPLHSLEVR